MKHSLTRNQIKARVIRALSGLSQEEFEIASRMDNIGRIEVGRREVSRREPSASQLARMCAVIGITPEDCEDLMQEAERLQRRNLERQRLADGWRREPAGSGTPSIQEILEEFETHIGSGEAEASRRAARNVEREQAQFLWNQLGTIETLERQAVVMRASRDFQTWAMVEILCRESRDLAAVDPAGSESLARLAVEVAERLAVIDSWRHRVQGFALAHLAEAHRAAGAAERAMTVRTEARQLWDAGEDPDGILQTPAALA